MFYYILNIYPTPHVSTSSNIQTKTKLGLLDTMALVAANDPTGQAHIKKSNGRVMRLPKKIPKNGSKLAQNMVPKKE